MKHAHDTLMYQEAHASAALIEAQLRGNRACLEDLGARLRAAPPPFVVTCARGSSDHAAAFAKYVLETHLGRVTASASPSVTSVYDAPLQLRGALFVAISQSGRSPDLLRAAEMAREAGAHVVALVNAADSPLASLADTVVPLGAGPERSVAATKSYLATLAAVLQLAACWADDATLHHALARLPEDLARGWEADWTPLAHGLRTAHNLFVVGRGFGFGAALEMALKFKETCGLHAEAFSSAEVRHGPMALVGRGFPVLALAQDDGTRAPTMELVEEFRARGAPVWLAAPGAGGGHALPLAADLPAITTPLVAVQSFYRAASALSLARGYDPDVPPHLNKVTETL